MIWEAIFKYIEAWASKKQLYSSVGKAMYVDEEKRTITFEPIDGATVENVRLQSQIGSSKGFVQIPKQDSFVIVTYLDDARPFVSSCSEIDKIIIDTELVQFNGGENEGLINIVQLTEKLNNLVSEVNAIKDKYNDHNNVIPAGTVIVSVTGQATGNLNTTPIDLSIKTGDDADNATDFNKNDFEDTKIIH